MTPSFGQSAFGQSAFGQSSFGELVRTLRQRHGTTQTQLALQTGLSERTLRRWESGMHLPRRAEIELLLAHVPATPQERAHLTALVRYASAEQPAMLVEAPPLQTDTIAPTLPVSALLRSLRTRRGWGQQQLADELGVHRVTVNRWEIGGKMASADMLARLIARLCVSAEERQAMWNAGLIGTTGALSLEDCRHHVTWLERETTLTPNPLYELTSLSLQYALRGWCRTSDQAVRLLARTETEYAGWLFYHDRRPESHTTVTRALQRVVDRYKPEAFWWHALNQLSTHVAHSKGNVAAACFLTGWAKRLPDPTLMADALAEAAIHAVDMCEPDTAMRLIRAAQRTDPTATTERYMYYAAARVRLLVASDYDGWETIVQQGVLPAQQIHSLLQGASGANRAKAYGLAEAYLHRIEPLLNPEIPNQLQRKFAEQCKMLGQ